MEKGVHFGSSPAKVRSRLPDIKTVKDAHDGRASTRALAPGPQQTITNNRHIGIIVARNTRARIADQRSLNKEFAGS
jgi:hypothetical protein